MKLKKEEVNRVRFCPSPTGVPHVGVIRTALFNWAYAKHTNGELIFRIEDTDAKRDSEESYNQIIEALRWLGLDWTEGVEKGGEYGPYRQSERHQIYNEVLNKLLEAGYAYKSYSTQEEIKERNVANGKPEQMGYDGYDRNLTDEQIAKYEAEGRKPVIRFRMPDEDITFNDLIRKEITFKKEYLQDYVLARQDGTPLYTLTNPVDDAMMKVSLVLRGEDLLSSTGRQIALYAALEDLGIADFTPDFGHLPYVMGEGNKKLSKRDPESNFFLYRDSGFLPEGIYNYLSLLGWSISPDNDIFSVDEMVKSFEVTSVNPNPARFDFKKAKAINAEHIRMLELDDFTRRIVPFLHKADLVSSDNFDSLNDREKEIIEQAAPLIQTRITLLSEAESMLSFLFAKNDEITYDEDSEKQMSKIEPELAKKLLEKTIEIIENLSDYNRDTLKEGLFEALTEYAKPRVAFTPLRIAISGKRVSPPLFESMEILGKEDTIIRLKNAISKL